MSIHDGDIDAIDSDLRGQRNRSFYGCKVDSDMGA